MTFQYSSMDEKQYQKSQMAWPAFNSRATPIILVQILVRNFSNDQENLTCPL